MTVRALDLFCGAGGATKGLQHAGFHVTGIDIKPQPRYCGDLFVQADALKPPFFVGGNFDFVWASPPCQAYSSVTPANRRGAHPDLVAPTRRMVAAFGIPYVIENVPGAPLGHYITLCGGMFGLRTYRHRRFETSWVVFQPHHPIHSIKTATKGRRMAWERGQHVSITGSVGTYLSKGAMGIDWMQSDELCEAIPPAYSEFIGKSAMQYLRQAA